MKTSWYVMDKRGLFLARGGQWVEEQKFALAHTTEQAYVNSVRYGGAALALPDEKVREQFVHDAVTGAVIVLCLFIFGMCIGGI